MVDNVWSNENSSGNKTIEMKMKEILVKNE